ncbi:hypothetical protein [Kitasatospora sp. KL5]|uniref:hypothetical protein n=1 Tax=Kitasatospora sp. KL5 TaxID=3425125 RepID=UPI003D6F5052
MTAIHLSGVATGTGDRSRPRAALPALCATQITGRGILYYAFPVLAPHITADTGMTTLLLALVPGPIALPVGIAILVGTIRGNLTLLHATAVTDRWGTNAYGHLTAQLGAPAAIAGALAPWATAAITPSLGGGCPGLFGVLAATSAAAALFTAASTVRRNP